MTEKKYIKRNKLRKKLKRMKNILHADIKRIKNGSKKGVSITMSKSKKFKEEK